MALIHGGQLESIARQYNIPISEWLDLSTGISPISYPVPEIPLNVWQQLPQQHHALINAAQEYYACQNVLVTNGSQSIIKALPTLWREEMPESKQVFLPSQGYKEHQHAWLTAGYQAIFYHEQLPELSEIPQHGVLVVINPNNPSTQIFSRATLEKYQAEITRKQGLLIIDEAFMDIADESMASIVNNKHMLVLRSFGKFFGLAGIRIGFLITGRFWYSVFSEYLGPWQVNGPAQFIATRALNDYQWQQQQKQDLNRLRIQQQQAIHHCLNNVFTNMVDVTIKATDLFITTTFHPAKLALAIYHHLCQQAVYVRLTDEKNALRFGIASNQQLLHLVKALTIALTKVSAQFAKNYEHNIEISEVINKTN